MGEDGGTEPVERVVLIADADAVLDAAVPWPRTRALEIEDLPWLTQAAWDAYPHRAPFESQEAVFRHHQEIFLGEWGAFMPIASPVALTEDGYIAGAVATVLRVSREGAPDCPAVLTCLTLPDHRRRGVAAGLLAVAARGAKAVGERRLALAVDEPNEAARALCARLGFVEVSRGPAGS